MRNGGDGERFIDVPAFNDTPELEEDDPTDIAQVSRRSSVVEAPTSRPSSPARKSRSKRPPAGGKGGKASDRKTLLSAPPSELPLRLAGSRPVEVTIEEMPENEDANEDAPVSASGKKAGKKAASGPKSKSSGPRSKRAPSKAPSSRRSPSRAPAAAGAEAPASRVPASFDPKTTLVDDEVQRRVVHAVRASVPPAAKGKKKAEREDQISIPPSADLDANDERFFEEGESLSRPPPPRALARGAGMADAEPSVPMAIVPPERRQKLTNFVKIAVAVSSVLCFAALVRAGASHLSRPAEHTVAAQSMVAAPSSPTSEPAREVALAPVPEAPKVAAPSEAPAAVAAAAAQPAAAVDTAAAPPTAAATGAMAQVAGPDTTAAADPAVPAKSAKEEREDARKALERGKLKDASEAGQRSVALDPTDAEAWLILGSAEQELGHAKAAREAFTQCAKEAKTGPVRECGLMLR